VITNSIGPVTNTATKVTVIPAPTAPYPAAVLADHPLSYYRLDEPNPYADGTIAYDYRGGYNAIYTNATTGVGGYTSLSTPQTDPTETATEFGLPNFGNNSYAGNVPSYLDFATPASNNAAISVEAWVQAAQIQNTDAGMATLGYGFGGEEFNLDTGGRSSSLHSYRFLVVDANGVSRSASSAVIAGSDNNWHHLVGVCDEAHGQVLLYIDGVLQASGTAPAGAGIRSFSAPLSIGARMGTSGDTDFTNQFAGTIDDVAIYNTALSFGQVTTHYYAAGIAPLITGLAPSNSPAVNENGTITFTASASGTAPLTYQWLDNNNNPVGGNSLSLTLTNVQQSQAGTYTLSVANTYGTATTNLNLTVNSGAPQITVDLQPTNATVYAGTVFTYTVTVTGSEPFTYVWTRNGSVISGATNSTYTFNALQGTNNYQVTVSNGNLPNASSVVATLIGFPAPTLDPFSFSRKMKITFSGYNRSETLSEFPVLVKIGSSVPGFSYSQFASPTGGDLRFTSANGTNEIAHEIDEWNDANGVSWVWVQLPALSTNTDFIWAYWGNAAAVTLPDYSTNGSVWVPPAFLGMPDYDVVYHLKESGFPYADSSLQYPALTGTAPSPTPGIVGTGQACSGSHLDAGFMTNIDDAFTLSAWVNISPTASSIQSVWANKAGGNSSGFGLFVNSFNTTDQKLILETGNGNSSTPTLASAGGAVSFGQWHLLAAAVNRTNSSGHLYVDGFEVSATGSVRPDFSTATNDVNLGTLIGGSFPMTGTMDESRIRSGNSSSNWIWASYMTIAQNTNLQSYSSVSNSAVVITFQTAPGSLILTWPQGTLLEATNVVGPYTTNNATSPYTNTPSAKQKFYKIKVR
jgi:hypothetical protein